ncbi:MAG: hypothetical protein GY716_19100 [bacterium]|nr:hypothetical protein [bacterium]
MRNTSRHLALFALIALAAAPAAVTGTACPDVDGDGQITSVDLLRVHVAFATTTSDPRYSTAADVDSSGIVDGDDLAWVAMALGTGCN